MEMQHEEGTSPPIPRSQRDKENTPHSRRKSSAASKPPSARPLQKGRTSHELSSELTSTRLKRREDEVRGRLSSPPTSTSKEDIAGEEHKVSCASTSTLNKRWTRGKYKLSSPLTVKSLDQMSDKELDVSSALASPLNSPAETRGKASSPTSTIQNHTAGEEHEVSPASASTLKAGSETASLTRKTRAPRRKINDSREMHFIKEAEEVTGKAGIEVSTNPTRNGNDFFDEEVKLESGKQNTPHSDRKSSAASKPPSARQLQKARTSQSSKGPRLSLEEDDTPISVRTERIKFKGEHSSPPSSSPASPRKGRQGPDDTTQTSDTGERQIDGGIHTHIHTTSLSAYVYSAREQRRDAKSEHCVPLSLIGSEETAGQEPEVSSRLQKRRGARSMLSANSMSTSIDKMPSEEHDESSELKSTLNTQEEISGEQQEVLSSTLKRRGRGARSKLSSRLTSASLEKISNEEHESSSELASARLKRRGAGARGRFSSPPTSTNQEDITDEEHEVSCASTSTLNKRGTRGKYKLSSPLTAKILDQMSDEELDVSSALAPPLNSAVETIGKASSPTSTIQNHTAGEEHEVSPASASTLKVGSETASLTRKTRAPRRKINDSREMKLIREAEEVMRKAAIEISANPTRNGNDFFEEEVKLEKKEKLHASSEWVLLRNNILESLKEGSAWTWNWLNSGSSYDGTKVARADEVDCMFFPKNIPGDWMEIDICGAPPEFCFIKLRDLSSSDPKYLALKKLCGDQGMIKSTLFRNKVFDLFTKGIANNRKAKAGQPSATGAAFPVNYYVIPTDQGMLPISLDLVPALHFTTWPKMLKDFFRKLPDNVKEAVEKVGFHAVPKQCLDASDNPDCLWRLSFSAAEKQMTNFLDGKNRDLSSAVGTTYRKHVMRMVKRILEICKGIDNSKRKRSCPSVQELSKAVTSLQEQRNVEIKCFSTFQIRTLFWDDFYVQLPADDDWERKKWRTRLQETLRNLRKMLTGEKQVLHFFVPSLNTMETVPIEEREFLYIILYIAEKIF